MEPIRINKTEIINLEKGKLPPQAIELEEAVIGSMMIDRNGQDDAISILNSECFYKEQHRIIFEAISFIYNKNEPVDLLTVSNELKKRGQLELAGGDFYLIGLTQKISSSAHIDFHCRIILQKYIQRKSIKISSEIIEKSYDENIDVFELLETAYKEYGNVTDLITVGKQSDFKQNVKAYLEVKKKDFGIPSCLSNLNRKLNGYQNTDLIILGGRPGSGKTAFALNEIIECGINNIPVAFFSLEMSEKQIIARMLSIVSGIDVTKINNYNLFPDEVLKLKDAADLLATFPIIIDDTSGISPIELKIKSSKLKREKKIEMIVVDYLQLMRMKGQKFNNKENEVSEISKSLKNLAKDLDVPVLALSQLSRSVEQRGSSKRPMLSDLRDSGSIEQDADIVMFMYRPEYYNITEWDDEERGITKDQAEIYVAKYRHGETGYCRCGCVLQYMRFMDLENLGQDIKYKYFKTEKPEIKDVPVIEIPKISATEAFGLQETEGEVPF